jgi:hypothetical protein
MKGDTSVCRASRFRINVRCTTTSLSPFSMKCEMRLYYVCLPYEEKGDVRNRGMSRIRCMCPKISVVALSLTKLRNFLKPPSTLAFLLPQTLLHHRRLPSSIPILEHTVASSPALEFAATSSLASKHAIPSSTSTSQLR